MGKIVTHIAETFDNKRVCFYECDYMERFKISEVLKLSAELAGHDYTQKGLSHTFLWENGMVFLVSKVSFYILEYPSNQQELISSTWESGKKGAMFMRGFEIKDKNDGRSLIQGSTGWILANPISRHIIRPSDFQYAMPQITDRESKALPVGKISAEKLELVGRYKVRISDIDANGHVYNANYADFAVDCISEKLYKKPIENFRINFSSEAKFGDTIDIFTQTIGNQTTVIGKLGDKECFSAEFVWR